MSSLKATVTWLACVAAVGAFYGVAAVFKKDGIPLPAFPFQIMGAIFAYCLLQTGGAILQFTRRNES